jgi:hypothetical protein
MRVRVCVGVRVRAPSSPDLAPTYFFLFPKLKTTLKGRRFQTIEEIQENVIRELCAITESEIGRALRREKKSLYV